MNEEYIDNPFWSRKTNLDTRIKSPLPGDLTCFDIEKAKQFIKQLEKENERLKNVIVRLKEENKNLELRYNLIKIELDMTRGGIDLAQITKQGK